MGDLIVTAADEGFAGLLFGLLGSLTQAGWGGDIAVLDLGLAAASRERMSAQVHHCLTPGWDLPVAPELRQREPQLRGLTARPFLRDLLPGYQRYLWIDADAWVQQAWALDWYLQGARGGRIAITPQVDRCYVHRQDVFEWRLQRLAAGFGPEAARQALWQTYFNAGVFCLEADAPHWARWAVHFRQGLDASEGSLCCDQSALNHALWTERLDVHPLPARCNWLCHLAWPWADPGSGLLQEPLAPHEPLGIVHLSSATKDGMVEVARSAGSRVLDLRSPYGRNSG